MNWLLNRYDYLEVFDGNGVEHPLIGGKLCGNKIPNSIESTGRDIFLRFHSDSSGTRTGFEIHQHASK